MCPTPVFVYCLGQCVPPPPPTPEVTLLGLLALSLGSAHQPASTTLWKAGFFGGGGWGRAVNSSMLYFGFILSSALFPHCSCWSRVERLAHFPGKYFELQARE